MSLNRYQLPPLVLKDLYKNSLVELGEESISGNEPGRRLSTLGNNQRQVLIVVDNKEILHLPHDELIFLLDILAACHLTIEDVAILNLDKNQPVAYTDFNEQLKPAKVLLFGVSPGQVGLPLEFPLYQVQHYNRQTWLAALKLQAFKDNKDEKTKLWNCLKQIFLA